MRENGREVKIRDIQTLCQMTEFAVTRKELLYAIVQQPQNSSVPVVKTLYNFKICI